MITWAYIVVSRLAVLSKCAVRDETGYVSGKCRIVKTEVVKMAKTKEREELFFEDYGNPSKEQQELADKLKESLMKAVENENEEYDIVERLEHDATLREELANVLTVLTILESSEEPRADMELYEQTYLKAIDVTIRLAKVIHPLSGVGAETMRSAYEILDTFEEICHPLLTKITESNIEAFADLLSEKEYDEVLYGRKKAIGALRTEGEDQYAAGVAVYRMETTPVLNTAVVRLDYMYVKEEFRSFGTANLLMAALIRPILGDNDARLTLSYKPVGTTDEDDDEYATAIEDEFDRIEEFISSWKFDISMDMSNDFYISMRDIKNAPFAGVSKKGIVSLAEMGDKAASAVKKYFTRRNNEYTGYMLSTPAEYYDREASCVYTEDGSTVDGILLCHRYKNGDYRIDHVSFNPEDDPSASDVITRMIGYSREILMEKGDGDAFVTGELVTEEGFALLKKLVPEVKTMLTFECMLSPLDDGQTISTEEWDMLRKEAGMDTAGETEEIIKED